jgi:D-amino peptidase
MRPPVWCAVALVLIIGSTLAGPGRHAGGSQEKRSLKIYISVDMEGVTGVVTADQLSPQGFEYQKFREQMTDEVNAAIEGAAAAGATEFVVSDSHGNAESLLPDRLTPNPAVTLVRGFPRPLGMMEGIDASFAGVIFIGYHASTDNPAGVRAHTISSAYLSNISLDGVPVPEAGINAAIAGEFGVPVIMISGDDRIVKEARALLGEIEGAAVKYATGFHSARTLLPAAGTALIRDKATAAVKRIGEFKPYKIKTPVRLDVSFKNYRPAEVLSYLPVVERTRSHSVRFIAKDMVEASKFIEFITTYEPGLSP